MIFLIGKIFVYLLLAGIVGGIAGWLFRNLQGQRTEESASRAVHDAKSKLPQLESLLRGRDEQISKLKDELQEGRARLSEQDQALRAGEQKLREQEREARRWQQSAGAKPSALDEDPAADDANGGDPDNLITELSQEIARLQAQLELPQGEASGGAEIAGETLLQVEFEALRAQLANAEHRLKIASADLAHEQTRVAELEGERELQNRSLQVLHQQLELERTRRVAAG